MNQELKTHEQTIKRKPSFGWTPKYNEVFRTQLNKTVFFVIAKDTIESLEWDFVFEDETTLEARRPAHGFHWGQKISIKFDYGKVTIDSKSIQSPFFDFGRNYKRVKLFIYAFQKAENSYDRKALAELEEKTNRANNMDDYEISESLAPPKQLTKPKLWIPIVGGILISIVCGFLIAFLSTKIGYIIGIFELAVGFIIAFLFKYLIKLSNYTNFDKLHYILIGVVLLTYFLNQYFLYLLFMNELNDASFSFLNFMQLRFEEGLTIDSLETGWIGLLVSWVFQIGFTYGAAYIQFTSHLTQYQFEKIPMEVMDFAYYHFVKGKDENGVRKELAKKGWSNEKDQDDVFEAMGAIQTMRVMNRMD